MRLLISKTDPAAQMPTYAHPGDAGMDVSSLEELVIAPGERKLVRTGLKMELPMDAEAQIRPRSGLALKYGITVLNSPGTIDAGYRGEVGVILVNLGPESFKVEKGMRIAQMVIQPVCRAAVVEVEHLAGTDRGEGGFGSTGV